MIIQDENNVRSLNLIGILQKEKTNQGWGSNLHITQVPYLVVMKDVS